MMKATARLYLNDAKTAVVLAGDKDAATLYATPGDEIPDNAVERFGLVDGTTKAGAAQAAKEQKSGQDKEKKAGEDKGGAGNGGGDGGEPAVLTSIKGIGDSTAAKLVAAGIADVSALAAIDAAAPPAIEGLPPRFDWAAVTTAARAAITAQALG